MSDKDFRKECDELISQLRAEMSSGELSRLDADNNMVQSLIDEILLAREDMNDTKLQMFSDKVINIKKKMDWAMTQI